MLQENKTLQRFDIEFIMHHNINLLLIYTPLSRVGQGRKSIVICFRVVDFRLKEDILLIEQIKNKISSTNLISTLTFNRMNQSHDVISSS